MFVVGAEFKYYRIPPNHTCAYPVTLCLSAHFPSPVLNVHAIQVVLFWHAKFHYMIFLITSTGFVYNNFVLSKAKKFILIVFATNNDPKVFL